MTEVVNVRNCKPGTYEYCARGSIFGNPYEIGPDGSRLQVIERYRRWFNFCLKDPRFVNELKKLKGKRLGCFCKVNNTEVPCHLDIIAEYVDKNL